MGIYFKKTWFEEIEEAIGDRFVLTQPINIQMYNGEEIVDPFIPPEIYVPDWYVQLVEDEGGIWEN